MKNIKVIDMCYKHYLVLYRMRLDSRSIALVKLRTCERDSFNKELKRLRKDKDVSIVHVSVVSLPAKVVFENIIENISTL